MLREVSANHLNNQLTAPAHWELELNPCGGRFNNPNLKNQFHPSFKFHTTHTHFKPVMMSFKLCVMGGGGVGKSALTIRLVTDTFLDEFDPTIEDSYRKQTQVDGESVVLDILDTAGQQEFYSLQDEWIRSSEGFLLAYSITSRASFEEIEERFEKIQRTKAAEEASSDRPVPVVLVGNKCDARQERVVEYSEGEELARRLGCAFFETSALLRHNHEACFFDLVRQIRNQRYPGGVRKRSGSGLGGRGSKMCVIL